MGLFGSSFGQPDPQGYMLNIGQPPQPQDAWQMAMQPTQQQAAQQFQQQYGQPAPQQPAPPAQKPGFFGKGGIGAGILGGIADGVARWGGAQPGYASSMQQQQEYAQRLQELQAERQARMQERQQSAEQGFETWKQQQQWARDNPDPTTLQQNVDYAYSLPEGDPRREAAIRGIQGYGFAPEVMDARTQAQIAVADHRLGNSLTLKQTPGASGGGGLTPTARAKYIADAQAAIARGADPAAVQARLRQMGVQ